MKKLNKKGFTLVELLAVIVILAVLATVAITNVLPMMNKAKLGTVGDSLVSVIKNGFQTCALSQTDSEKIDSICIAATIARDYVQNVDASEIISAKPTDSNIKITFKKNGFTIDIKDTTYADAIEGLSEVKDYYENGKSTYTYENGKWSAS